jgi:REase_AHJR-like protein
MTTIQREAERLDALAAEYRKKGYAVQIHPQAEELPPFLRNYDIDLVATSSAGNVVAQVRAASRFDADQALELAEAVERNPGWRFEMAFVSPPVAPDVPVQEQLADDQKVTRMLENAETLSKEGHVEAAGLIAWSALETVLRRRAQSAAPEIERQSSARVLKQLYSLGRLEPETYEKLLRLLEFRNAVAHGFQPRNGAPSMPEMIEEIRHLQSAA